MSINRRSGEPNSKVIRIRTWIEDNIAVGETFDCSGDIAKTINMPAKFISRIINEWDGDMVSAKRQVGHAIKYTRLK